MAASPPLQRQSPATRFELRIAAEARAKEAEARAQKLLDEQMRRADLKDVLPVPEEDVVHAYRERLYRSETARSRCQREDTEKEVVVRRQSSWSSPPTRAEPSSGLESVPVIAPASREPLPSRQDMPIDTAAIRKLQADLDSERRRVRKLEQDLRSTTKQVEQLRAERDEAVRHHVQAVCADAKTEAARLEAQVMELKRLCEDSVQEKRRLEDEIEQGRCRELELNRQLENARREKRQLEDEIEIDRGRRTSGDRERKLPSKAREERVIRRSSNKLNDTMTIKKTTVDYAIVVPKKTNAKKRWWGVLM